MLVKFYFKISSKKYFVFVQNRVTRAKVYQCGFRFRFISAEEVEMSVISKLDPGVDYVNDNNHFFIFFFSEFTFLAENSKKNLC